MAQIINLNPITDSPYDIVTSTVDETSVVEISVPITRVTVDV